MVAVLLALASSATIQVEAPAFDQAWVNAPARFDITEFGGGVSARVFEGGTGHELPAKVQQQRDKRYVYWIRADDGSTSATYIIETGAVPAQTPVFVGAGDKLAYGRKGVTADLGIGRWASVMPIDWNGNGTWDLLYSCQDALQSGVYLYIQESQNVFRRVRRLTDGVWHAALADMNGNGVEDLLAGDHWWENVREAHGWNRHEGPLEKPEGDIRAFMARQVDWDGDGHLDLIAAASDWGEYSAEKGFDETGTWTGGPLHGHLWFHRNTGTNEEPVYAEGVRLKADDKPIDVYGNPGPCIADWDGDGDLDLICGEYRNGFTYFENVGTRTNPRLGAPQPVMTRNGRLTTDSGMANPVVCDWNGNGLPDLVAGHADGRVSVMLNLGMSRGTPLFAEEFYLQEINPPIRSGGAAAPWLDTQTGDLYCGNSAGYIEIYRVREGSYLNGQRLREGRVPFRVVAGYNRSVRGPADATLGYAMPCLGDLNGDGRNEIIYNSITGHIGRLSVQRIGLVTRDPVHVAWPGEPPSPEWNWWKPEPGQLVVQWRTRPNVLDWDGDGLDDLIAIDHEGYLALYRNAGGMLEPGQRVFVDKQGAPLRLNSGKGAESGRVMFHLADWNGNGRLDLICSSSITGWYENVGDNRYVWQGEFDGLARMGRGAAPQAVDWTGDGTLDLILGAEDGHIYCYHRAAIEQAERLDAQRR